jgi:hypothetical protein
MGKGYRLVLSFALACVVVASRPAYASTLSGPSSLTLTEGNSSSPLIFTFTNTTGVNVTFQQVGATIPGYLPDPNDFANLSPAPFGTTPCNPGSIIANGNNCTFQVTFTTENPASETDHDFGTATQMLFAVAPGGAILASTSISVTVNDPAPVPEPSTVALCGSGFALLLLGHAWRKRRQRLLSDEGRNP